MSVIREEYYEGETLLEASYVKAPGEKPLPAIIFCHDWKGKSAFVEEKAKLATTWGYHGFAIDMYGKGVLGKNRDECMDLITPFMKDRSFLKRRICAGLEYVKSCPFVDVNKIVVMGFCFGGLCVLDLARHNADIQGVISFHGLLRPPEVDYAKKITPKILVLHGDIDPQVPFEEMANFVYEMKERASDWQLVDFGNAYHAFTNPSANDPQFGTVYCPKTEKRAFAYAKFFTEECFLE